MLVEIDPSNPRAAEWSSLAKTFNGVVQRTGFGEFDVTADHNVFLATFNFDDEQWVMGDFIRGVRFDNSAKLLRLTIEPEKTRVLNPENGHSLSVLLNEKSPQKFVVDPRLEKPVVEIPPLFKGVKEFVNGYGRKLGELHSSMRINFEAQNVRYALGFVYNLASAYLEQQSTREPIAIAV